MSFIRMLRRVLLLLLTSLHLVIVCFPGQLFAQRKQGQDRLDSLLSEVPKMQEDTAGAILINDIAGEQMRINPDEGLKWAARELALSKKIGWLQGETRAYISFGNNHMVKGDYPAALEAYLGALSRAEKQGDKGNIAAVSGNIGNIYMRNMDYPAALKYYFKTLKMAGDRNNKRQMQFALSNIGSVYYNQDKYAEALEHYLKALRIAEERNDGQGIAAQTGNIGNSYTSLKQPAAALAYNFKALRMATEKGDKRSIGLNLGNIGNTYYSIAVDSASPSSDTLVLPTREANLARSIEYLTRGIEALRAAGFKEHVPLFTSTLSDALALQNDYRSALQFYKESIEIRDSLFNKENDKKLLTTALEYQYAKAEDSIKLEGEKRSLRLQQEAQLAVLHRDYERRQALAKTDKERQQLKYEENLKSQQINASFRQKEADADAAHQRAAALARTAEGRRTALASSALRRQQNLLLASLGGGALLLLICVLAFRAYRQRRASNIVIAAEQEKSEALLRNILPAEVARELKEKGFAAARQYDDVSILFTDFVAFTKVGELLSPQALVKELHECFSAFDGIILRNGLEKIKTIGDAYMAVCGLPQSDPRHAQKTVQAALEIRNFIAERKMHERVLEIRIGINSGPVVAGIVGVKKFAYDIWGDAVNTAARMEQHGEAGAINISQNTFELVKADFHCVYRGRIAAKNKGEVEMYFVEAPVRNRPLAAA